MKGRSFRAAQVLGMLLAGWLYSLPSAAAPAFQADSPVEAADAVYGKLPSFPRENQYLRADTKKQATNSTLVSRLIQYHTSVKGRSPLYRIDWKVTLADYLGANDYLQSENYPGSAFLRANPMERDRQLIQSLNLVQRNALIQALVDSFGSQQTSDSLTRPPSQSQNRTPAPRGVRKSPPVSPSGSGGSSADLLGPIERSYSPSGEAQFLRP